MLEHLQKHIPYHFDQVKLLEQAMTHSSHANEQSEEAGHNERLEFLGDAVLELCVSDTLFRRFPGAREGELTALRSHLVNQDMLASLARNLRINQCIVLGKGEEAQGGRERDSLLSDAFEALLGAVYLDGGFDVARRVVERLFRPLMPTQLGKKEGNRDSKSCLQEKTQQMYKARPIYSLAQSEGPEHDKIFTVRLELPDKTIFMASSSSVKKAEQMAAQKALAHIDA